MSVALYAGGLVACAMLIIFNGSKLSRYGDLIADLTGLGKAWLGAVLMATVTSLPELVSAIGAVTIFNTPDIVAGDMFGSCAFNLLILAFLDLIVPGRPFLSFVAPSHTLTLFISMFLIGLATIPVVFPGLSMPLGWVGGFSVAIIVAYAIFMRVLFKRDAGSGDIPAAASQRPESMQISLSTALTRYAMYASVVVVAALFLPFFADRLATGIGVSKSLVGTFLVALATSLPELAVSIAAIKLGSYEMAIGNLLGSNIFNVFILALADVMFIRGPLLHTINATHAVTGLTVILISAVAGMAITSRSKTKATQLSASSAVMILLYALMVVAHIVLQPVADK